MRRYTEALEPTEFKPVESGEKMKKKFRMTWLVASMVAGTMLVGSGCGGLETDQEENATRQVSRHGKKKNKPQADAGPVAADSSVAEDSAPDGAVSNSDGQWLCEDAYFTALYEGWFLQKHFVLKEAAYLMDMVDSGMSDQAICEDIQATVPGADQQDCQFWGEVIASIPSVVSSYADSGVGVHFMITGGVTYPDPYGRDPAQIFSTISCDGPHYL